MWYDNMWLVTCSRVNVLGLHVFCFSIYIFSAEVLCGFMCYLVHTSALNLSLFTQPPNTLLNMMAKVII